MADLSPHIFGPAPPVQPASGCTRDELVAIVHSLFRLDGMHVREGEALSLLPPDEVRRAVQYGAGSYPRLTRQLAAFGPGVRGVQEPVPQCGEREIFFGVGYGGDRRFVGYVECPMDASTGPVRTRALEFDLP